MLNQILYLLTVDMQHSSRGDKFTSYARLEHGASVIGEGGRVEYTSGETMALDLVATVPCSSTDVHSLVNVTKYPLIGKIALRSGTQNNIVHVALLLNMIVTVLHTPLILFNKSTNNIIVLILYKQKIDFLTVLMITV